MELFLGLRKSTTPHGKNQVSIRMIKSKRSIPEYSHVLRTCENWHNILLVDILSFTRLANCEPYPSPSEFRHRSWNEQWRDEAAGDGGVAL